MAMQCSRRTWLALAVAQAVGITGCGTILYPERRGQPRGHLDLGVVALDALGLLFFFVPGVIAFAVDFATGAIYLPPECPPYAVPLAAGPLEKIETHPGSSLAEVEAVVAQRAGRAIDLSHEEVRREPLADLREFWAARRKVLDPERPA